MIKNKGQTERIYSTLDAYQAGFLTLRGHAPELEITSYWCDIHNHRIPRPHFQCPNRIVKALKLYPRCILCNLQGSEVEGLRQRMDWSKRQMARHLDIPWQTYQAISDFKRTGKRSELYLRLQELIQKILENPRQYMRPEIIQKLSLSPLDFFNRYIGRFPWEDEGKWPHPVWPRGVATKLDDVANL